MALVGRWDTVPERDLLVVVGGEHGHPVVVHPDPAIPVAGRDGDADAGGQEVGDGGVEGVDGDVLQYKLGLAWSQDGPHQQDGEQQDEEESQQARAQAERRLLPPLEPMPLAVLG